MSSKNKIRKLLTMNVVDVAQGLQSLHVPGKVVPDNLSSGWVFVGQGNIIRVHVSADTYFAFAEQSNANTVSVSTSPAVKILSGEHYIVCQHDYVRASANPLRVELLEL
jgi:hypothetical protein